MGNALGNNKQISGIFLSLGMLLTFYGQQALAAPVSAALHLHTPHYSEDVTYQLQWMNIPLGKATIHWQEQERFYKADITIETSGVARIFNTQRRELHTTGRIARHNNSLTYYPEHYANPVKYKKKKREMHVWYDHEGIEQRYEVTPPDNRATRPEVPEDQRNQALDILTAILYVREHVQKGENMIHFTVFDARRLTGIRLSKLAGKTPLSYLGTHTPDAGYTDKELKDYKDEEPDVTVEFANADSLFPSRAFATTLLGTVEAVVTSRQRKATP